VRERLDQQPLACPVELQVGSILNLPFPDDSFDAVWVAQVLIYLSDEECGQALAELRRVTRPGGLIAAKESTGPLCPYPIEPRYWFPVYTHALMNVFRGAPRSPALGPWFERTGLEAIQQRGVLVERLAPVEQVTRRASARLYQFMAEIAEVVDLPPGGREFWAAQRDPESPTALVNHPDLTVGAIHYVVTGRVPAGASNDVSASQCTDTQSIT
jgi:SAM-dependent methyltransferase